MHSRAQPPAAPSGRWTPLSGGQVGLTLAGLAVFFYLLKTDEDGFVFLDYVNLAFHEAGHPIFGLLGPTLGLYGGTLGQLAMPLLVAVSFWRRGDAIGVTVGTVWLFENGLNIARYMADARSQLLPLVGGEHDWTEILGRWGMLESDARLAAMLTAVSWLGMLGASLWLWLLWRGMRQADASGPRG